jgi:hypothetical protein
LREVAGFVRAHDVVNEPVPLKGDCIALFAEEKEIGLGFRKVRPAVFGANEVVAGLAPSLSLPMNAGGNGVVAQSSYPAEVNADEGGGPIVPFALRPWSDKGWSHERVNCRLTVWRSAARAGEQSEQREVSAATPC